MPKSIAKPAVSATPATEEKFAFAKPVAILYKAKDIKPLSNEAADAAIKSIVANGKSLRRKAHIAACGIALHWQAHGDWTKMRALGDAIGQVMSQSMRKGYLEWCETFTGLKWDKENNSFTYPKGKERTFNLTGDKQAAEDTSAFVGALNQPFYDRNFGDKPFREFAFDAYMASVVEKVSKEIERREKTKGADKQKIKVKAEELSKLRHFVESMGITVGNA